MTTYSDLNDVYCDPVPTNQFQTQSPMVMELTARRRLLTTPPGSTVQVKSIKVAEDEMIQSKSQSNQTKITLTLAALSAFFTLLCVVLLYFIIFGKTSNEPIANGSYKKLVDELEHIKSNLSVLSSLQQSFANTTNGTSNSSVSAVEESAALALVSTLFNQSKEVLKIVNQSLLTMETVANASDCQLMPAEDISYVQNHLQAVKLNLTNLHHNLEECMDKTNTSDQVDEVLSTTSSAREQPSVLNNSHSQDQSVFDSSYYVESVNKSNWSNARDYCTSHGGNLFTTSEDLKPDFYEKFFSNTSLTTTPLPKFWIGLREFNMSSNASGGSYALYKVQWFWITNMTHAAKHNGTDYSSTNEAIYCAFLQRKTNEKQNSIGKEKCEENLGFICKCVTKSKCSGNWLIFQ